MHVFFIPSWYPTVERPTAGCFLREQALAIGRFGEDVQVSVSLHGSGAYLLDPRTPVKSVRRLMRFLDVPSRRVESVGVNVVEFDRPAITWPMPLAGGNLRGILKNHHANFVDAEELHGRVDLIHAQVGLPAGWIAWKLARRFKRPFIITEHMGPFPPRSRAFLRPDGSLTVRLRNSYAESAINVAVSPWLSSAMAGFGIGRLTVVPNLVDEERFSPGSGRSSGNDFVFLTLCSLLPGKGVDDLLKATALASTEIPSLRLVVGGEGPLRGSLEALAEQLGISRRVSWLGAIDPTDTPPLYRNCDAFILPSRAETFGVVYVEALACGKPVIATRCGGPESIVNEKNGLLVPVGDVSAIAGAMVEMARHPARFQLSGIRSDFLERFSRPAVVRQILALYRSTLEGERKNMTAREA